MMATRKVMGKFRHASSQSTITALSPGRFASIGLGSETKRKINPVQILHWIGLNRHSVIHPRMWRECWAHGELCKYGFDLSGKCVIQLHHP